MEIKNIIRMIRRWAWLLAFGLVVGGLSGNLVRLFQTPIDQTSARILVLRPAQAEENTDAYLSDQQLAQSNIQFLTTSPLLEGASSLPHTGRSAMIGLLFSVGIVFLFEYFDDTLRSPEDVARILNLAVIGHLGEIINRREGESVDVHVLNNPRSPVSEAVRSLFTNLKFTNIDRALKTILVTSSGPAEGKTMIAVSLATIIAQGGKRVLLVDADMRRPRIHKIFGLANQIGLSTLFRGNITVRLVMQSIVGLENLFIITSGELPPNPTELLGSAIMDQILHEAGQDVDVIVVDSPPSSVADYQILAAKLDGVLMVIRPGHTHADAALGLLEQVGRVGGSILGVVMNKIPRSSNHYGGYYSQPREGNQAGLHENNQTMSLLPQADSQGVGYFDQQQYQSPKNFDNVFQSCEQLEVNLPPKDLPATPNIITKPRKGRKSLRISEELTYSIQ